jgi:hypothetical protein
MPQGGAAQHRPDALLTHVHRSPFLFIPHRSCRRRFAPTAILMPVVE